MRQSEWGRRDSNWFDLATPGRRSPPNVSQPTSEPLLNPIAEHRSPTIAGQIEEDVAWVDLSKYQNRSYDPGRGRLIRAVWYFTSLMLFESGWFPFAGPKQMVLRLFGARIGRGLVIKPHVRIKYPWRLCCWRPLLDRARSLDR